MPEMNVKRLCGVSVASAISGRGALYGAQDSVVAASGTLGDEGHLGRAGLHHFLVVVRVDRDAALHAVLLQTAHAVFQPDLAGERPPAGQFLVAHVGHESSLGGLVHDRRTDGRVILHLRDAPRFGAVGDESVGEQDDGRHVLHGDASRLEGVVETVARRRGGHHDRRALAVAAVEGLLEVALLGFRRQARRGASALHVHDHQRQFGHHGQSQRLALERQARAGGGRHGEVPGIGRADGRADAGDLVFGLHGLHPEVLALGQLFEDHRGGGDGIRAAEERQPGLLGRGAEPPRRGHVARDRAVFGQSSCWRSPLSAGRRGASAARPTTTSGSSVITAGPAPRS